MKFNPNNKDKLTYGECLDPAMGITNEDIADKYLKDYAQWIYKQGPADNMEKALEIARHNLGYYAGYFSNEVRARVEKLFICSHPIFGSINDNGIPTAEVAFELGRNLGNIKKYK